MANELDIFKGGLPDFMKSGELDEATKTIVGANKKLGGPRRISIKGGVFRSMQGGQEIAKDDARAQEWIILQASPVHRIFYDGQYKEGKISSPACWSDNNKTPSDDVPEPVSKTCIECPNNIKGSGMGNGRACRFNRRLAVVMANNINGEVYQVILPATSVFGAGEQNKWPLDEYTKFIAGNGVSLSHVVTEARFDTESATPKLIFKPLRAVTKEEYDVIVDKAKQPNTKALVELKINLPKSDDTKKLENSEPVKRATKTKKEPPKNASDLVAEWD